MKFGEVSIRHRLYSWRDDPYIVMWFGIPWDKHDGGERGMPMSIGSGVYGKTDGFDFPKEDDEVDHEIPS